MKRLIILTLCLMLLAITLGCAKKAVITETPISVSTDIAKIVELNEDLDISDLDGLDADLAAMLDELER